MANNHIVKTGHDVPEISYDDTSRTLKIEGVCMPENSVELFTPVFNELNNFQEDKLTIYANLKYVNSMSSKQLLRLFFIAKEKFNSFDVVWEYDNEDQLMRMKGEELKQVLEIDQFEVKQS